MNQPRLGRSRVRQFRVKRINPPFVYALATQPETYAPCNVAFCEGRAIVAAVIHNGSEDGIAFRLCREHADDLLRGLEHPHGADSKEI